MPSFHRPVLAGLVLLAATGLAQAQETSNKMKVVILSPDLKLTCRVLYNSQAKDVEFSKDGPFVCTVNDRNLDIPDTNRWDKALAVNLSKGSYDLDFDDNLKAPLLSFKKIDGCQFSVRFQNGEGAWAQFKVTRGPKDAQARWVADGGSQISVQTNFEISAETLTFKKDRIYPD